VKDQAKKGGEEEDSVKKAKKEKAKKLSQKID